MQGTARPTSQEGAGFCDNDLAAFCSSLVTPTGHQRAPWFALECPQALLLYPEQNPIQRGNQGPGDRLQRSPKTWQHPERKLGLPPFSLMGSWEVYWALASVYGRGPKAPGGHLVMVPIMSLEGTETVWLCTPGCSGLAAQFSHHGTPKPLLL